MNTTHIKRFKRFGRSQLMRFGTLVMVMLSLMMVVPAQPAAAATPNVTVDWVYAERSEDYSGDQFYLITFIGQRNASGQAVASSTYSTEAGAWADLDTGEFIQNDVNIAQYLSDRTYVVAGLDRDDGNDFANNTAAMANLKTYLWNRFVAEAAAHPNYSKMEMAILMGGWLKEGINLYRSNDDLSGTSPMLSMLVPGQTRGVGFSNAIGAKYHLQFKVGA